MEKKVLYENIVKFNFMSNIEPFAALDYSDDKNFGLLTVFILVESSDSKNYLCTIISVLKNSK